ncbi:MAG: restriction endonuclease subunit S [Rugosibacter sp.]|nr:restriction endonuclease subunit S [Rugosibacter sp.]
MEGLEIREVNYSETLTNKDFRTDSDFWTKAPKQNLKLAYAPIGSILKTSQYGISIEMNENDRGYPIYRMNEIHNMLCDFDVNKCADIEADEFQIFSLNDRDVLFNRTNSYEWVGRTGLFRKQVGKDFIFASYLVRFVPDEKKVLPEYLVAFLSSTYGVWDIRRRARHSINQTNVNPEEVKEVQIPLLANKLQQGIKSCFDRATENLLEAKQLYEKAETLLLGTLSLANFSPSAEAVNIKPFKDSFSATGRLDAEYYQPKYEDYQAHALAYLYGWQPLMQACNLKDSNFTPEDFTAYKYIELADIDNSGGITGCTEAPGNELPSRARRIVDAGDVLISSVEGSLPSCAIVPEAMNEALCSTGFYVINSDKINSETLLVLFKSPLMQNLLKQGCSGTILTAINKTEFQKIPVPMIEDGAQTKIAAMIQESFSLKAESERLLDVAKRAVEIAIEQDEKASMVYIEENS